MTLDQFFADNPEWVPFADLAVKPPDAIEAVSEYPELSGCELLTREWELIGPHITRLAFYMRMRLEGTSHRMAEMCALQRAPTGETNDTFWGGRKHFSEVYGEAYATRIRGLLAKRGAKLGPNDEYMPELARFQGDPEAVIPFGGGRDHIKNLCESRGWGCEGAVNVKHRQPDSDPHENGVPLANDIIAESARNMIKKDPDLKRKSRREIREMVIAKHGPSS